MPEHWSKIPLILEFTSILIGTHIKLIIFFKNILSILNLTIKQDLIFLNLIIMSDLITSGFAVELDLIIFGLPVEPDPTSFGLVLKPCHSPAFRIKYYILNYFFNVKYISCK
jgi:hypothetical protein